MSRKQMGWLLVIFSSVGAVAIGTLGGLVILDALDCDVSSAQLVVGFLLATVIFLPLTVAILRELYGR